jgi:hypothetical protein
MMGATVGRNRKAAETESRAKRPMAANKMAMFLFIGPAQLQKESETGAS